ncbi:MAG: hypothetical protein ABI137_12475 [Antricoccus sp.]
MQLALPPRQRPRRGRCETDDRGRGSELLNQSAYQGTPHVEQMMALVQHYRPRSGGGCSLDHGAPIWMQQAKQGLPVAAALDFAALVGRDGVIDDGDRLVGEHVERRSEVAISAAWGCLRPRYRGEPPVPSVGPLAKHCVIRYQDERPVAAPARRLQPDHGFARSRRQYEIGVLIAAVPVTFKRVERPLLVSTPLPVEATRSELGR